MNVGLEEHIAELKEIQSTLLEESRKAEDAGHKALALAQKMKFKAWDIADEIAELRNGDET